MHSVTIKNFLQSGLYFMRKTWPFGFGEVVAFALTPMIKRLVLLLLLLGNFRYLSKNAEPDMNLAESLNLLWPVVVSVFGVMVLPLMVAAFGKFSARGRRRKTTRAIKQEYCRILFGSDEIVSCWDDYYDGQVAIMVYIVFILIISPAFLYFSWRLFIVYFVVAILFATVCAKKISFSQEHKFGRLFNKLADSDQYLNTMRYAAFCIYIVACAVVIIVSPHKVPLEFVFVIIIGMRVQLARGKKVLGFFLWEAENEVVAKQLAKQADSGK